MSDPPQPVPPAELPAPPLPPLVEPGLARSRTHEAVSWRHC